MSKKTRPKTVRRVSLGISECLESALADIKQHMPAVDLRWLLQRVVEEGIYAVADHVEQKQTIRLVLRFDVAHGSRRGMAREAELDSINKLLANVDREVSHA